MLGWAALTFEPTWKDCPLSRIVLIAALTENHVIGRDNALPWRLPNDLKHFKAKTLGRTIIMGRKTFESIGRPLPDRRTIVVTRNAAFSHDGITTAASLDDAIKQASDQDEIYIVGGAQVYEQAIDLADRLELTLVHTNLDGDAFFPDFPDDKWQQAADERHDADERHAYSYSFRTYDRKR